MQLTIRTNPQEESVIATGWTMGVREFVVPPP